VDRSFFRFVAKHAFDRRTDTADRRIYRQLFRRSAPAMAFHHITSHGEDGSRPQGPLYPRNNNYNRFINTLLVLIYNTPVSGASEIPCSAVKTNFKI